MNKITYWEFDKEHLKDSAISMRENIALNYELAQLKDPKTYDEIVNDYCVDALKQAEEIIGKRMHGTVVEVGAGTGIYSCQIAKNEEVEKVYSVEYSKGCVEELMTYVIKSFNFESKVENKIFPVVGSFDNISLPDNSVDFVIDVGSLHHSEDRFKTIKEIYRILKIGGYLIGVDRFSANTSTNLDLNKRLDVEYSKEFKDVRGYDPNEKLTRRMNSEHDPLLAEWEYFIVKSGFRPFIFWIHLFPPKRKLLGAIHKIFFKILGQKLMKKKITQWGNSKIPYYPFFSNKPMKMNMLIVAKKEPYFEMP